MNNKEKIITKEELVKDLKGLGIKQGDLLNLKVSLKSIGKVENGANTLIEAALEVVGEEGTLVSDAFVEVHKMPLKKKALDYISKSDSPSYAGALANAMIKHPKSFRSLHPIQKFVAIGQFAEKLMYAHKPEAFAYDVLRKMAEQGGKNLKVGSDKKVPGVGTTHIAICDLGFIQEREKQGVYYETEIGEVKEFERKWVGGCGFGFSNLMPYYGEAGAVLAEGRIGNASGKLTDMGKTLAVEKEVLKEKPELILCNSPSCYDCRVSWSFSPLTEIGFAFNNLKKGNLRKFIATLSLMKRRKIYQGSGL